MKKVLFTLIAAIAFCGSIYAQTNETHWPEFNDSPYEQHGDIVANVSIDGNMITSTFDYWDENLLCYIDYNYEVAAFRNGECRGHSFLMSYEGDEYPTTNMMGIYYNPGSDSGKEVTFVLFDHANQVEYTYCISSESILTGEDYANYANPVQLSFYHTFTKEINPYTADFGGWYFISSPVGAVNANEVLGLRTPDFDFYSFDQTHELEWINHRDEEEYTLQPGIGYLYANNSGEDLTFVGAPYESSEDMQVPLVYSETNSDPYMWGWNLVGNPFTQTATVDCEEYYRMNPANGSEVIVGEGNEIGPMEGIFVQATAPDQSVTFSTTQRSTQGQIVLNVSKDDRGNTIDRAIVRFGKGGMLSKFMLNESHTKMYIPKDDNDYAVVRSNKSGKLPVSFQPAENGTYKINVSANLVMTYLHLVDKLTGADIDLLRTPSYSFDASTTDNADRFVLVFRAAVTPFHPLIIKDDASGFGFFSNGEWIINNEGDALLQVIDVNGQILINEEINGSVSKHINAAPGVYILRLVNGKDEKVQKIVVE